MTKLLNILYSALVMSILATLYFGWKEFYSMREEVLHFVRVAYGELVQLVMDHPASSMFMVTLILIWMIVLVTNFRDAAEE